MNTLTGRFLRNLLAVTAMLLVALAVVGGYAALALFLDPYLGTVGAFGVMLVLTAFVTAGLYTWLPMD